MPAANESHMPPSRLRRLVKAAFIRADEGALIDLRMWFDRFPDEARRAAARDGHLQALIGDLLAEPDLSGKA